MSGIFDSSSVDFFLVYYGYKKRALCGKVNANVTSCSCVLPPDVDRMRCQRCGDSNLLKQMNNRDISFAAAEAPRPGCTSREEFQCFQVSHCVLSLLGAMNWRQDGYTHQDRGGLTLETRAISRGCSSLCTTIMPLCLTTQVIMDSPLSRERLPHLFCFRELLCLHSAYRNMAPTQATPAPKSLILSIPTHAPMHF